MSFAAGFLNAWKDNEATAERERLQQETKDARDSALATTAKNRQEDQEYRASRDATQDKNQLDTLLSTRMGTLITARDAFQVSKKMPVGHKQNLLFLKDVLGDAADAGDILNKLNQSPKAAAELRATWTAGAKKGYEPRGEQLIEAIGVLAANEDEVSAYTDWSEGQDPVANLDSIDLTDTAAFYKSIQAYSGSMVRPEATITYTNRRAFGQGNFATQEEKNAEIKIFDNEILRMANAEKIRLNQEPDGVQDNNALITSLTNDIAAYKDDPTALRNQFGKDAFDKLDEEEAFMFADTIWQFNDYQGQDDPMPIQDRPPKPTTEEEKSTLQLVNEEDDLANIPPNSWWITPDGQVMWKGNT